MSGVDSAGHSTPLSVGNLKQDLSGAAGQRRSVDMLMREPSTDTADLAAARAEGVERATAGQARASSVREQGLLQWRIGESVGKSLHERMNQH